MLYVAYNLFLIIYTERASGPDNWKENLTDVRLQLTGGRVQWGWGFDQWLMGIAEAGLP